MALILTDIEGNEYPVHASTNHSEKMSADGMLTFDVIETKENAAFINNISKMWKVTNVKGANDRQRYVVVITSRKAIKNKQTVQVTAKEEQFDYLETHRVYENISGSYPAVAYLEKIFNNTPYDFVLLDNANAIEWENSGDGMTKMAMFLKWLTRYGFEFKFDPNINRFTLGRHISRQPAYVLSKKINANDLNIEEDATNFYTYRRGYGNYEGEDNMHEAKLERFYKSPLAEIEGIGIREMEPFTDGRIKNKNLMDETLFESIEDSLKTTVTFDFVRIGQNYPYAQPEIGDEIPVIDTTIQFKRLLRIVEIKTTRDAHHKIIKQAITVGDPSRTTRYQAKSSGAINSIDDLLSGRTKLRESVLPAAIKRATDMLTETASELSFSEKGIIAVDKVNPNYLTLFNSSGLGVSSDGGQTFRNAITRGEINADLITAGSINADYIRSGQLDANLVNVIGKKGLIMITGDEIIAQSDYTKAKTSLRPNGLFVTRPDGAEWIANGLFKYNTDLQAAAPATMTSGVTVSGQYYHTTNTYDSTCETFYFQHKSRYLRLMGRAHMYHPSTTTASGTLSVRGFSGTNISGSQHIPADFTNESDGMFVSIIVDLGIPDYSRKQFYVQLKSGNSSSAIRFRRTTCELYD